jgi:hypothetical protein
MAATGDINDAFDSLLLCENQLVSEGFQEGLSAGQKRGWKEGLALGSKKGVEIGAEVGFYAGFAAGWIESLEPAAEDSKAAGGGEKRQKVAGQLRKLLALAEAFPADNIRDLDILDRLLALRAKFKIVCSLLKVRLFVNIVKTLSTVSGSACMDRSPLAQVRGTVVNSQYFKETGKIIYLIFIFLQKCNKIFENYCAHTINYKYF